MIVLKKVIKHALAIQSKNYENLCPSSYGGELYRFIQKNFGRLKANPMTRIPVQVEMERWILEMGGRVEEKTFFEGVPVIIRL